MNFLNDDDYYRQYQILTAAVSDVELIVILKDGRRLVMPLWWSPRLSKATPEQRNNWNILPFGDALEWEEIDEHISCKCILKGNPFPGAVPPSNSLNVDGRKAEEIA